MLVHLSLSYELLVFLAATGLLIWSLRHEGKGIFLGKIVAIVIMMLSVVLMFCSYSADPSEWESGKHLMEKKMETKESKPGKDHGNPPTSKKSASKHRR